MSYRVESSQFLGVRREPLRAPERLDERIFSFVINGHHFTATDRPVPDRDSPDNERVIGRIAAGDVIYDVFLAVDDAPDPRPTVAESLTARELQVASLIADGKCDKEIARHLGISNYTVREHLRRIFTKLNVSRRSAVVSLILRSEFSNANG